MSAGRAARPGSDGEHRVQEELGTIARADRFYDEQVLDRLNPRMQEFVARQEMFFLSTADRNGECDSTFRAGPTGFLQVLNEKTLAYPEYRGNGVMASLGNIRENPHVGILMIDFFRDRIGLHVNGHARLVSDDVMRAIHPHLPVDPVPGRRPQVWVEVGVEEAYIHCSKHIPRLAKAPIRTGAAGEGVGEGDGEQAWGTDDVKRKGGDYFGAAAQARAGERPVIGRAQRADDPPASEGLDGAVRTIRRVRALQTGDGDIWRREAERALAEARAATEASADGERHDFRGWFT
ncbi:pyridoxamine 5'-phosphate oxidase family protein [Streptomyces sp. RB6PN25]|uniref:Pyridoxamine 5'-phosphate oxidase family protein n=1 Tax=Streptomyces humicola TaxID=2953240 RepID=A0ABT1PVU2_9ACTN|nr:pyridoxamine 5'-phosphate oxidase family protein [Streptomyces humicola]MCQ4081780.1 pyridoxamine 5'-phosphate oxidase family protein [Streptomyces humicola]